MEKIQEVQVNGLSYHRYEEWRHGGGTTVWLVRSTGNPHDRNAVKVCGDGKGQIGWVPQAVNADIARRIDAGEQLTAQILRAEPSDFRIAVYSRQGKEAPADKPLTIHTPLAVVTSLSASGPPNVGVQSKLEPYVGQTLPLRTTPTRTSVTAYKPGRGDLVWFRKSDLPPDAFSAIEQGQAYAAVVDNHKIAIMQGQRPAAETEQKIQPTPQKEENMNNAITRLIDTNKSAAQDAAVLEAGRIANNTVVKLVKPHTPLMLKGVIGTPMGKLLVANVAVVAAQQLRGEDSALKALTEAMATAAFQEIYQTIDLEGMLASLMNDPNIKRAMTKLDKKSPAKGE